MDFMDTAAEVAAEIDDILQEARNTAAQEGERINNEEAAKLVVLSMICAELRMIRKGIK